MDMRKFNVMKWSQSIKNDYFRKKFLDFTLTYGIPFNMGMGLAIQNLNVKECVVQSPAKFRRRNHIGTAHAISQALLGEYAAGLLITQKFDFESYRFVITNLNINYHKPGTGTLTGRCLAPEVWPDLKEGEAFVDMYTEVKNVKGELISDIKTLWQIKSWNKTKKK